MPKPQLPPYLLRKEMLEVVFEASEIEHLKKMVIQDGCRTLNEYVRKALIYYEAYNKKMNLKNVIE